MLFVDYRAGSKELVAPLQAMGLPVEETTLDFSDVCFEGRGEGGKPVSIGIEFKKLPELVQSLRTQRFQGYQLKGMRTTFDYSYLFIEGELLYDAEGGLLRRAGKRSFRPLPGQMSVSELLKRLHVLHLRGGVNPWWSVSRKDILQGIAALYHTWHDTDLDKHKSHLGIYNAPSLLPVSSFRRTVYTFPGVGMRASLAVEKHFGGSLKRAVTAPIAEWAEIQTEDDKGNLRRLGTKVASQIVESFERS